MLILQRNVGGEIQQEFWLGYLFIILVLCLMNTALLRLAADLVVKEIPPFITAFCLSLAGVVVLFSALFVIKIIQISAKPSIFYRNSFSPLIEPPFAQILPLALFLLVSWILTSVNLTDSDSKKIGFGRGLAVTAMQTGFLAGIGFLLTALSFWL